jgi:micrococcal nuclease
MKYILTILFIIGASAIYAVAQKALTKPTPTDLVTAKVVRITDGDTIHVLIADKYETIRLIGINAPELKDPDPQKKCWADQAKAKADQMLSGMTVQLEADPTQSDRDKYQRLLRYVWWNGADFNLWMIQKGYAAEYTYDKPYKYQKEFKAAQEQAVKDKWGIWDTSGCK